ncbi:MAG: H(+)/Cl(-) exchange transporter ClcA [Gemmatimonadaceae bacterium]|nr:H(+)/Cl(-) exchange transporter ClcA [Gemmatimonadaceae bacterium]
MKHDEGDSTGDDRPRSATADGLTVSPALDVVVDAAQVPDERSPIDQRTLWICFLAILLGVASAILALLLMWLIALVTNFAFFGDASIERRAPADAVARLGLWVVPIPVIGGLVVGLMARYGSRAIRGHGIPEAMEQVLTNRSRIPARLTVLKPLSSAIAIGTGGPFGAEGPIIATGGAVGSLVGQFTACSPAERKTLLGAGAAAGMAATFGSPVAAVLLAVELLLFEYRPRSIIPVALAATVATGMRIAFEGSKPAFGMPDVGPAPLSALAFYVILGALMGLVAAGVTRAVYAVEDRFEHLPVHWMWWPALGAVAVGVIGYFAPDTLGVGYYNITAILSNHLPITAVAFLCVMKFLSWLIALGSGTSGGTLAPLFTIGGGVGVLLGGATVALLPHAGVDVRIAGLVGMAALFAGASRAMLASAIFAFETTLQPAAILPLLGGCAAAYLVSWLAMRNTIMTEKIARRGVQAPNEYATDPLDHVLVRDVASHPVTVLRTTQTIGEVREWIASGSKGSSHQGFPILDKSDTLVGVLTRRDLLSTEAEGASVASLITQLPRFVYDDCTVRQAADHMVNHDIGRLPVVNREGKPRVIGMMTRSDVLSSYRMRIAEYEPEAPSRNLPFLRRREQTRSQDAGEPRQEREDASNKPG